MKTTQSPNVYCNPTMWKGMKIRFFPSQNKYFCDGSHHFLGGTDSVEEMKKCIDTYLDGWDCVRKKS